MLGVAEVEMAVVAVAAVDAVLPVDDQAEAEVEDDDDDALNPRPRCLGPHPDPHNKEHPLLEP